MAHKARALGHKIRGSSPNLFRRNKSGNIFDVVVKASLDELRQPVQQTVRNRADVLGFLEGKANFETQAHRAVVEDPKVVLGASAPVCEIANLLESVPSSFRQETVGWNRKRWVADIHGDIRAH